MQSAAAIVREEELHSAQEQASAENISNDSSEQAKPSEGKLIVLDVDEQDAETYNSFSRHYEYLAQVKKKALIPTILDDLLRYAWVYILGITVTVLCVHKITQVQSTRDLTSALNVAQSSCESLRNESLLLQAQRQSLSEHASIRKQALEKLGMIMPKTEAEVVIQLDRR